jgi:hypothetical protein
MICVKYGYNVPLFNFLYADDTDIFHHLMQSFHLGCGYSIYFYYEVSRFINYSKSRDRENALF